MVPIQSQTGPSVSSLGLHPRKAPLSEPLPTSSRTVPYKLNRKVYRHRNLIERLFCRLKNWRRIATRYDRLARNFLSGLALVAVAAEWAQ